MAANTPSVERATHQTQAGTDVDVVTFSYPGRTLCITNRGDVDLYWTYSSTSTPDDPTVGGADCYVVPAGAVRFFDQPAGFRVVKLIGTGMVYSAEVY